MEARELRIGNILNYDTAEGEILPSVIDWQDLKWISEDTKGFNLVHSAIPLTEEWLLKLGFYKNIDKELFQKGGFEIDYSTIKCYFYLPYYGDWYVEIEHVHQLQNLYFALTGQELTFKTK